MGEPVRHRQTKGAETDMFDLQPPRHTSTLHNSTIDERARRLVGRDIQKVEFGWPLGMPYCRPLGQGLWEVRSDLSGGRIARVIFFIKEGEMVLLHAFEKKTQRT